HPEERKKHIRIIAKQGYTKEYPADLRKKDGTVINTLITSVARKDKNGNVIGFQGTIRDITEWKKAERRLKYAQFSIDNAADAIYWTDNNGRFFLVNDTACSTYGYSREELLRMSIPDIFPDFPPKRYQEFWDKIKEEGMMIFETTVTKKGGEAVPVEVSVVHLIFEGQEYGCGFVRDITERKEAEAKASHLNSVLLAVRDLDQLITHEKDPARLIVQACEVLAWTRGYHNVWVALFNDSGHVTAAAESGLGEEVFRKMRERLDTGDLPGCVRSALAGKGGVVVTEDPATDCTAGCPLSATCSPEQRGVMTARLESGGRVYGIISLAVPLSLIHDREEQALFMEAASDLAFALRASDMETERKAAERALQESEEKFRALAENSPDSIMRFDRHCRHLYANPVIEQQSGIPAEEFIGKTHSELGFPKDLVELWEDAIQNVFATGKENRIEFKLPDGIWIDWLLVPEFSPDGEVKVVVTAGRDITDRKAAEQALEVANKKLQLLSGITRHDILNQITGLAGYTDLLSEILPDDPDMRKYIDRITKATSDIERQITFTRDYEHLGVDPSGWQRVADAAGRAASGCADRSVNVSIDTGVLEVFADPMLEK
ncbi:MAG: PAS domain S-box protein, partial [Methanogenium sp.]|nr:PAS domain S-box protein [Methanogenium sp.]